MTDELAGANSEGVSATMPLAELLAGWSVGLSLSDVPGEVRYAACTHLLDGIGTAVAAARVGAALPATRVAQALGGPPEALSLGGGDRISAPAAAMADGALVHALDFDDTHRDGLVHATAVVLPTAFAVGQQVRADGPEVLTAALIGYELICRLGAGARHGFHARGLHATSICGPVAAAATAARLMKLDVATTTDAMGIAGSLAGGLLEFLTTGASTKQLHPGWAAMGGIMAARLAAAGGDGPATVLEGPRGLYASLSARPLDSSRLTLGLGVNWEVSNLSIKPYPACQLMHAALDAASELRGELVLSDVSEVQVAVHPESAAIVAEPAAAKAVPRTPYDAKFSLPWSMAALLIDGQLTLETYTDKNLRRDDVRELSRKIVTTPLMSERAAADAPASVRVITLDGRSARSEVPCSAGGPGRPLSRTEVLAKLRSNVGDCDELAERVLGLEQLSHLGPLVELAARLSETNQLSGLQPANRRNT